MNPLVKAFLFPALLFASLFTNYAAKYELALNLAVCLGTVILVQRAVRSGEYFWAAGLFAIAVVFSPILFLAKLFLLMGLAFIVACLGLWTALRVQPARVWKSETE